MATPFSHVIAAGTLGVALRPERAPIRLWILGAICSVVPDVDAIGFWMGVPYEHPFGHRGMTHSLAFAALLGAFIVARFFAEAEWKPHRWRLFLYFFLATASHGVLDAMTNGGLGVAFFAPFDHTRYFFPLRPIEVSPISITGFLTWRGAEILASEVLWVWLPAFVIASVFHVARRRAARSRNDEGC